MRVKLILSGLIVTAFLFCLISYSQAAVDPWWQNRYPGEHPWQESDSPPMDGETTISGSSSVIWIIDVPTRIIMIRVSEVKPEVTRPTKSVSRIDL